jgi:hypothetical protein
MARGHKKAAGCSAWVLLIVIIFGIVQTFSTKREPPPAQPNVAIPVVDTPPPTASKVPPPALATTASKDQLAKESRPDPNAKKPSMPRARVLFAAARNLDKAEKPEGAIVFYRQVVMECRGTPESDQAIVRLKALGGKVPELAESIPPKEGDPYVPPKGVKHHYASSKAAGEEFDRMMSQAMQSVMNEGNGQGGQPGMPGRMGSHLCGAPTLDGTPCRSPVQGIGYCYLHR